MGELSNISVPQWFLSAIGLFFLGSLWTIWKGYLDRKGQGIGEKRRIGSRATDDASGSSSRNAWIDRLIEALKSNGDVNAKVVESLTVLITKQDMLLESFRLSQIEHHEIMQKLKDIDGRKAIL